MDIGKAFAYVFDDEQWVSSILIAGLLLLVPFLGTILIIGYALEAARNVAMGSPRPLPKWDNFGEKLNLGFVGFVISLVYSLPVILIGGLIFCAAIGFAGASGSEESAVIAIFGSLGCLVPLLIVLALALQPLMLAAMVRYLQMGSLGEAFNFGAVIGMVRQDLGGWVVLWLLSILCSLVGSVGSIIVVGFIFTVPYGQAVFGHLLGQMLQRLGRPGGFEYAPPVV
ncbi:MAG: DUF4013 domain-containing protein [Chloroflexi bacterium OHK40]